MIPQSLLSYDYTMSKLNFFHTNVENYVESVKNQPPKAHI